MPFPSKKQRSAPRPIFGNDAIKILIRAIAAPILPVLTPGAKNLQPAQIKPAQPTTSSKN
jgi:hypothetical protein